MTTENISKKALTVDELKDIAKTLDSLADHGYVFALCPKCKIPLDKKERQECLCNTCGQFDIDSMLYKTNISHSC